MIISFQLKIGCAMCSNPFGLVNGQQVFQCPDVKCAEQYCNSCVEAIQGSSPKHPFVCMSCKTDKTPEHNVLLENHIIWKFMLKTYGAQSLVDLKEDGNSNFSYPVLKNIRHRLIHLKSRSNTLKMFVHNNENKGEIQIRNDQKLINDVDELCNNLKHLLSRIQKTQAEMEDRGIIFETCLKNYKKCMENFGQLCDTSTKTTNFRLDHLNALLCNPDIKNINEILEDIDFREYYLSRSKMQLISSPNETEQNNSLHDRLYKIERKLKKLLTIKEDLTCLYRSVQLLKNYIDEYDQLLRDAKVQEFPCSKFILLLEIMRVRTEEYQVSHSFPMTAKLMKIWKNDYSTDNEFKPKVIELFRSIENDLQDLSKDFNWQYSISYKVGVIGSGNVGKSALTINLAEVNEFSSMIDFERSTFGYLEFDTCNYKNPQNKRSIPITFIDMEGATDNDASELPGNYLQLIGKADCDVYLIVFNDLFSKHNRTCQTYVEEVLKRKCLLIRNQADQLFNQCFRQIYDEPYKKTRSTKFQAKMVLQSVKENAKKTFDERRLENDIYLIAAICDDNIKGTFFADFDLNRLKKKLIEFAMTDTRKCRISNIAIRTAETVINTCFRRGYAISQTKYKWLSAGASIIPFLNELPAYFGREKIRQVLGIHDCSPVTNRILSTQDSFEKYLAGKNISIAKEDLKSGEFQYLVAKATAGSKHQGNINTQLPPKCDVRAKIKSNEKDSSGSMCSAFETIARPVSTISIAAVPFVDDIALATVRAVPIAGLFANVLLSPIFAVYSFYSTAKRMNHELHSICNDLVTILRCFIDSCCTTNLENIQLPPLDLSHANSSSSDSDDD